MKVAFLLRQIRFGFSHDDHKLRKAVLFEGRPPSVFSPPSPTPGHLGIDWPEQGVLAQYCNSLGHRKYPFAMLHPAQS